MIQISFLKNTFQFLISFNVFVFCFSFLFLGLELHYRKSHEVVESISPEERLSAAFDALKTDTLSPFRAFGTPAKTSSLFKVQRKKLSISGTYAVR